MKNFRNSIVYIAIMLHALLFLFNHFFHPETFLNADRAKPRLATIRDFLSLPLEYEAVTELLSSRGIPGDYIFQAIIVGIIGQYGLIIFQIVLAILACVCLYSIAKLLFQSERLAFVAALIYMLLPHSLVFPHQLVTEAIFNPLLIFSFYYLSKYLSDNSSSSHLILSASFIGISALIRPVSVLYPFVIFAILLFYFRINSLRNHMSYLAISILPTCMWMLFIFTSTGEIGLGKSSSTRHDHGANMYDKITRISNNLPAKDQLLISQKYLQSEDTRVSVSQFISFVVEYPVVYLKHTGNVVAVFFGKTSINRLVVDVFGMDAGDMLGNPKKSWRRTVEQHGFFAFFKSAISAYPLLIFINLICSALFLILMLIAIVGGGITLWKSPLMLNRKILLLSIYLFIFYIFSVSQIAIYVQSRHRSPAEFAIVICFVTGCTFIYDSLYRKRKIDNKEEKQQEMLENTI